MGARQNYDWKARRYSDQQPYAGEPGDRPTGRAGRSRSPLKIGERHALVMQHAQSRCKRPVVGEDHAAFTGRHYLACMQAENRDRRNATDRPVAKAAANGAGRVLNDQQAARLCKLKDPIDLAWHAELVDRQDGLGTGTDLASHVLGIKVEGARVDVDEHGAGTDMSDDVDGSDE